MIPPYIGLLLRNILHNLNIRDYIFAKSVSTMNDDIGKSIIVENIKEHKKKKRSKNRKACEKSQDTGLEERDSST